MKRISFIIAAIFVVGLAFTACKESKKSEDKVESHESHEADDSDSDEQASKQAYHCTSSSCDAGKTYDNAGDCPACNAKLVVKTADADSVLTASCSCKSGGDCACEGGCKCTA